MTGVPSGEVARSLFGAWRLLRWDPAGTQFFDGTRGACIRSFWAAAIAAPLYAVITAISFTPSPTADPVRVMLVFAIGYVVMWTAFPLAMLYVAELLGRSQQYFRFIAVYNWAAVLQYTIVLLATIAADLMPPALGGALAFGALVFTLVYEWFIARTVLQIGLLPAAGVISVDVVLSLFINAITQRMG